MKAPPSPFIVIEALDAGGSQTQTDQLAARLQQAGYKVLQLHFPQEDRATGQLIYQKFLRARRAERPAFSRREQALLYLQDFFSRAEDIKKFLSPSSLSAEALAKADEGEIKRGWPRAVLSDRYYTSTLAYQTIGLTGRRRQAHIAWIKCLAAEGSPRLPKPDRVIMLDTPVGISLGHLKGRQPDYFENRQRLTAIRRSYLKLAGEEGWHIINSADHRGRQRSIADIHDEVWEHVKELIKE